MMSLTNDILADAIDDVGRGGDADPGHGVAGTFELEGALEVRAAVGLALVHSAAVVLPAPAHLPGLDEVLETRRDVEEARATRGQEPLVQVCGIEVGAQLIE